MIAEQVNIRIAGRSDFLRIVELIAWQNGSPCTRCLHSDEGSAAGVLFTMNKWDDEDSLTFVYAADANEQIAGAFGAELDSELRRCWLWGPFAQGGEDDVLGFCHVSVNEGANEGYVEFIGVDECARGGGIGRQLLETAMFWLYDHHRLPRIGLTTGDENFDLSTRRSQQ